MRSRFALLVALIATAAHAAAAQSTVAGVATDSLARRPLSDAVVQLVSADSVGRYGASATSDSLGRFAFGGVPRGRYMLGFFHPLLDSLGIEAPLRELRVDADGAMLRADVAVPGPARLRATICGAKGAADSALAVVVGTVRGATDGAPLSGATVTGDWLEYSLGTAGLGRRLGHLAATTGDNGWFALCGGAGKGSVALQASRGADSTDRFELAMPDGGFARRELYLGATSVVAISDSAVIAVPSAGDSFRRSATVRTRRIRTGNVRIAGSVVTAVGSKPLAGAQVSIVGGPQTVANDSGAWTIANAPAGTRMIDIHAVGYYPERRAVDVVSGAPPVRVALRTLKAVLDTVRVTAAALQGVPPAEFMQRRKSAFGHFLTAEDLQHRRMLRASDAFRNQPGVTVVHSGLGGDSIFMHGPPRRPTGSDPSDPTRCVPAIFIDGHWFPSITTADLDAMIAPQDIIGVEIYDESTVPPQFADFASGVPCGSIVIWTKMHTNP